jgi:hypothetical protein
MYVATLSLRQLNGTGNSLVLQVSYDGSFCLAIVINERFYTSSPP